MSPDPIPLPSDPIWGSTPLPYWSAILRSSVPPFLRSSVPPFLRSSVPPFLRSSVPPFLRSSVPPFLRSSVPPFLRSSVPPFLRSSVPPFLRSSVPPFLRSSVPPFLRSSVPPFLRSSVPPFLRSSVPPFLRSSVPLTSHVSELDPALSHLSPPLCSASDFIQAVPSTPLLLLVLTTSISPPSEDPHSDVLSEPIEFVLDYILKLGAHTRVRGTVYELKPSPSDSALPLSTVLTMTFNAGPPHRPLKEVIPVLTETTWSQDTGPLITKLKKLVNAKPEILMIFMALIRETTKYKSPEHSLTTWKMLYCVQLDTIIPSSTATSDTDSTSHSSQRDTASESSDDKGTQVIALPSEGATLQHYQEYVKYLQLQKGKLETRNATDKVIIDLGKKYALTIEMFLLNDSIFKSPCPDPPVDLQSKPCYATKAMEKAALVTELYSCIDH
ncbi:uncharacterized protein EDB91DRAFT_1248716 [Suillus paluster]|uniref:uncharacterized protein n=1 Tax=Suillus paluster TaxID=48578 RepID=UPI001B8744D0|nr:uncharacterized protein EDB91DRAFT_1248716 [Suillus paluster]KAG1739957.1 hypothetical protein EDB91DRAFT_1248716 [Suillus paluster]